MSSRPLVERPPVAGGLDLDVPGQDVRLRATRWPGVGSVPVLLLHGLASSRRFWDLVVPHLVPRQVEVQAAADGAALDQRPAAHGVPLTGRGRPATQTLTDASSGSAGVARNLSRPTGRTPAPSVGSGACRTPLSTSRAVLIC